VAQNGLGSNPRLGHVEFVLGKVELEQVPSKYFGFHCQFSFHQLLHTHHHLSSRADTICQIAADVPSGLSKINNGTGAGVYGHGVRKKLSFTFGQYTTVFQAEVYAIKACTIENLDRCYRNRNICILLCRQAAIKSLDNYQTNPKFSRTASNTLQNWFKIRQFD
jgi:hypothetical protein